MGSLNAQLDKWIKNNPNRKVGRLDINGHGSSASIASFFDAAALKDPNSEAYKFLLRLKPLMTKDSEIYILACEVAKGNAGQSFIQDFADIVNAEVIGYDDWYGGRPHGIEWHAFPGNSKPTPGHDWGAWQDSECKKVDDTLNSILDALSK